MLFRSEMVTGVTTPCIGVVAGGGARLRHDTEGERDGEGHHCAQELTTSLMERSGRRGRAAIDGGVGDSGEIPALLGFPSSVRAPGGRGGARPGSGVAGASAVSGNGDAERRRRRGGRAQSGSLTASICFWPPHCRGPCPRPRLIYPHPLLSRSVARAGTKGGSLVAACATLRDKRGRGRFERKRAHDRL